MDRPVRVLGESTSGSIAASFDSFYFSEYPGTVRVVYALCGSWSIAEEIAQESFIRAYRRWEEVGEMGVPGAWVRRVAGNLATSRFRRAQAEARALTRLLMRRERYAEPGPLPAVDETFWRLVRALPVRQAQAVALHYGDDLSVRDVAKVMGVAEGTVKAHLHAARGRLARHLDEGACDE